MKLPRVASNIVRAAAAAVPVIAWDAAGLGGAALVVYGVSLIYQPAAYIIGGGMLLSAAWLNARRD